MAYLESTDNRLGKISRDAFVEYCPAEDTYVIVTGKARREMTEAEVRRYRQHKAKQEAIARENERANREWKYQMDAQAKAAKLKEEATENLFDAVRAGFKLRWYHRVLYRLWKWARWALARM